MRLRSTLLALFVALVFTGSIAAQSVIVKPRKVVYRRTGKDVPDFKRTFEVRYPTFTGKLAPAALRGLKQGTDYWTIFDMKLADNLRGEDHWLSSFDYEVKYNNHNILDIWLIVEGVGAYPDGDIKYVVFDSRTGKKIGVADLFVPERMPGLLSKIREVMKLNEDKELSESEEMREELAARREITPEASKIEFKDLEGFTISDTGVTFHYDYGYPHVIQALEPLGEFFIPYAELKPFIRPDGLLARFVR